MTIPPETIKQAITLTRAGERERARALFEDIVRDDPDNVTAWLWLGEICSTLEDQLYALGKASALLPADSDGQRSLQAHLNEIRGFIQLGSPPPASPSTQPVPQGSVPAPADTHQARKQARENLLREAQRLSIIGDTETAIKMLTGLLENDPQDEQVWQLLGELEVDPAKKAAALEKVVALNPNNQEAARRLSALRPMLESPLKRGQYLEESGEFEQAIELYRSVVVHSTSPTERVEANRRIGELQIRKEALKAQPVNPTINLLRVAAGPVLLFAVMVFMQSGLNPLHTPLLAIPGLIFVLSGSLLVSATEMRPLHPLYIRYIGTPGTGDEPSTRRDLRLLGWALMLLPFSVFLVEAGFRLGALQASMIVRP